MSSTQASPAEGDKSPFSSPSTWIAIVILGLLLFLVILSSGKRQDGGRHGVSSTPAASMPAASTPAVSTLAVSTPAVSTLAALEGDGGAVLRPGDEARAIIAGIREKGRPYDTERVHLQAGKFRVAQKLADAHLLYFFAAREGHAPSAVVLGRTFDPVLFSPESNLMAEPQPMQAAKWYRVAAQKGSPEAETRLADLRTWAEVQARQGDETAQRLLLSLR